MNPILVTGATGLIGGEIARQLVAKDVPIRILVRDISNIPILNGSVEIVVGDFTNTDSLLNALSGIKNMFLASYDEPGIVEHQANVLDIAKRSGVQHVVRMSSDALEENQHLPSFQWHDICERQLERSGLGFTHIKPIWIMQNFESWVVNDCIRLPAGSGRIGLVDARDVAAVAVASLTKPGYQNKAYRLSTESLSFYEVAEQLSEATGRDISYIAIRPDVYQQELHHVGCDKAFIETTLGLFSDIEAGKNSDTHVIDTVERVHGHPGISFREFSQDYAHSF